MNFYTNGNEKVKLYSSVENKLLRVQKSYFYSLIIGDCGGRLPGDCWVYSQMVAMCVSWYYYGNAVNLKSDG